MPLVHCICRNKKHTTIILLIYLFSIYDGYFSSKKALPIYVLGKLIATCISPIRVTTEMQVANYTCRYLFFCLGLQQIKEHDSVTYAQL